MAEQPLLSRRAFLETAGALVAPPFLRRADAEPHVVVNDLHSQLNETHVRRIVTPRTAADVIHDLGDLPEAVIRMMLDHLSHSCCWGGPARAGIVSIVQCGRANVKRSVS